MPGSYDVIGRFPDSDQIYAGKVIFKRSGEKLKVIRKIRDKTIKGIGKVETAADSSRKVLRVLFSDDNKKYEVTYLIDTDLDNYGRLTGYLYLKEGGTEVPGLEALFSDHLEKWGL